MRTITLGRTGITVPQNAFGALPIQRISKEDAAQLLQCAYEGGMRFFDTARAYSDSEEKIGYAFGREGGIFKTGREHIFIASKTHAQTPQEFQNDLETSLRMLNCGYIDVYQFHQMDTCWKPGDGTGMYECMLKAKAEGKIRHIGATTHKVGVAMEIVQSRSLRDTPVSIQLPCDREGDGTLQTGQ
jgi:aryl-alcohol dehydrogenase-like predicted oxidoreductase